MNKDLKIKHGFTLAEVFSVHPKGGRKQAFTLAEVFSVHPKGGRKHGFTLAEVLITLGIIGVVAAMTLPVVVANVRGVQNAKKFQKAISTLSNAARMSMANYGFDYSGLDRTCNENSANDNPETSQSICSLFNGTLQGATFYWGVNDLKTPDGNTYNPDARLVHGWASFSDLSKVPVYRFADGSLLVLSNSIGAKPCSGSNAANAMVYFSSDGNVIAGTSCYGFIDVNGVKPPNKEIECSSGNNWSVSQNMDKFNCKVKNSDITDIFSVVFRNGTVEPYFHAGVAVLNSAR